MSLYFNYASVGLPILLLHDLSDIFRAIDQFINNTVLGFQFKHLFMISSIIFALNWLYFRIWILGYYFIRPMDKAYIQTL